MLCILCMRDRATEVCTHIQYMLLLNTVIIATSCLLHWYKNTIYLFHYYLLKSFLILDVQLWCVKIIQQKYKQMFWLHTRANWTDTKLWMSHKRQVINAVNLVWLLEPHGSWRQQKNICQMDRSQQILHGFCCKILHRSSWCPENKSYWLLCFNNSWQTETESPETQWRQLWHQQDKQ